MILSADLECILLARKGEDMSRTYIPFYLDQKTNITLYYDYVEQVFFTSSNEKKGRFYSILSGMAGVVVYLLLKDVVFRIGGGNGFFVILFSLLLSVLVAFGMIWGTANLIKKNWHRIEKTSAPVREGLLVYIRSGRKWLTSTLILMLFLFFFNIVNLLLLLVVPSSVLLFLTNTVMWAILFLMLWAVRPNKRIIVYRQLELKLDDT